MRRRDFLVSTAAVAAVPFLPVLAAPVEKYGAALLYQERFFVHDRDVMTFRWSELLRDSYDYEAGP